MDKPRKGKVNGPTDGSRVTSKRSQEYWGKIHVRRRGGGRKKLIQVIIIIIVITVNLYSTFCKKPQAH